MKDLAKYLITEYRVNSILKVNKMLFFIRLEELKNKKEYGAFKENYNFEAWIYGPVNRETYNELRLYFFDLDEAECFIYDKNSHMEVYDKYIKKYIDLTSEELVDLSHKNKGWIKARKGLKDDEPCTKFIDERLIYDF